MDKPEISIVLPCRNAAETLVAALQSILGQGFRGFELIVVDDGSSDGSMDALASLGDPRLRICRNLRQAGVVGASATGIALAKGEWVARMDADDLALPDRIGSQLELAGPQTGVVTCGVELIDSCGDGMLRYVEWANSLGSHEEISRSRFIECPVINPTAMVRREWLERSGGYCEVPWAEDHDLWLRLLELGCRFAKVPEVLLQWRDSSDRLTRRDPRYSEGARSRMRAHFIGRLESVREFGVVIAGAGPIGKRLARDLRRETVVVHGFFDVNPRRIGRRIHDIEVVSVDEIGQKWRSSVFLGAVGLDGRRDLVRDLALSTGREEGVDFWSVC